MKTNKFLSISIIVSTISVVLLVILFSATIEYKPLYTFLSVIASLTLMGGAGMAPISIAGLIANNYYDKKEARREAVRVAMREARGGQFQTVVSTVCCDPILVNDDEEEEEVKLYDVQFNDENSTSEKGWSMPLDYCLMWIDCNKNDDSTYFGDYRGGTVSVVSVSTGETVYEEAI